MSGAGNAAARGKSIRCRVSLLWVTALLALAASIYCAMWVLSSASLASGYCGQRMSLFAIEFRCRQPDLAMILAAVFFGIALLAAIRARRRERMPAA